MEYQIIIAIVTGTLLGLIWTLRWCTKRIFIYSIKKVAGNASERELAILYRINETKRMWRDKQFALRRLKRKIFGFSLKKMLADRKYRKRNEAMERKIQKTKRTIPTMPKSEPYKSSFEGATVHPVSPQLLDDSSPRGSLTEKPTT